MTRATRDRRPQLSVVVPLYDEAENLPELYRRLCRSLDGLGVAFELVLVDDGSGDATPDLLGRLAAADARVVVVRLSRNFGHQAAVCAGLGQARGDAVVVMDGDLQDPPEVLPAFVERWREGFDVVYAVRTKRKEGPAKRLGYYLFYRLLRAVADLDIPLDSGDFCLMDRKVVDTLNALPERQRFVRGLRTFVGFRQTGLEYERDARASGVPKYTFRKLVGLAVDGVVNFSGLPLRLAVAPGLLAAAAGLALGAWAVAGSPAGWVVVLAAVLVLGGLQLLALGVVGEYVRRIFLEAKGRPAYIVGEVIRTRAGAAGRTPEDPPGLPRRAKAG
jgi:dolichol-phosphate mannosyltransferase